MMTETGRVLTLLWNDSSGWHEKERVRQSIESTLRADGESLHVERTHHGGNMREVSEAIVSSGTDVLIAAGGDGTINAAASALVYKQTALGVIPAGTLNHFARDLHIPLDPEEAARIVLTSGTLEVDAGEVNGRVFINNSVLGLFPNYRSTREAWERRGFGRSKVGRLIAMAAGMLRVFWRMPHLSVEIEVGGTVRRLRTPFVLIGNNEHRMRGFAVGERSSLTEGSLWVYAMRPCTRWGLLRMLTGLVLGRTPRHSVFEVFRATCLRINSKPRRIGVGVDGEMVRMATPLEYRSLPKALRVITPLADSSLPIPGA
jgi:diacylglycerol kinase family enzyme